MTAIPALLLTLSAGQALSHVQAEEAVKTYAQAHKLPVPSKLHEVTTPEIARILHAKVFRVDGDPNLAADPDAYLVKGGKAYPLSRGIGGDGLGSMQVADLNGDGRAELVYCYS